MAKLMVNEVVYKILKEAEGIVPDKNNVGCRVYHFLNSVRNAIWAETTQEWLGRNNLTVSKIEQAFVSGYKPIYDFEKGDIACIEFSDGSNKFYEVDYVKHSQVWFTDETWCHEDDLILVCKAKNREV